MWEKAFENVVWKMAAILSRLNVLISNSSNGKEWVGSSLVG